MSLFLPSSEIVGMLFEVVDECLPRDRRIQSHSLDHGFRIDWKKIDCKDYSPDQLRATIFQEFADFIGWPWCRKNTPILMISISSISVVPQAASEKSFWNPLSIKIAKLAESVVQDCFVQLGLVCPAFPHWMIRQIVDSPHEWD